MDRKDVVYIVNGTAVQWWKRVAASKTFWVVAGFVLTAADRWNRGDISGTDFFQIVQIGVIGILIRTALARAELAANAGNPQVTAVQVKEKRVSAPAGIASVLAANAAACLIAAGSTLLLTACSRHLL